MTHRDAKLIFKFFLSTKNNKYISSSQNTIITAAHCCDGQSASSVKVVAGEHNLEKNEGFEQVRLKFIMLIQGSNRLDNNNK